MFKTKKIEFRSRYLNNTLKSLMDEMLAYCVDELKIQPVVTDTVSTPTEDQKLRRVSSTHREGRAIDISTRGWTKEQVVKFMGHFDKLYGTLGAITKNGRRALIIWHNAGSGDHFHVQIARDSSHVINYEVMLAAEQQELADKKA